MATADCGALSRLESLQLPLQLPLQLSLPDPDAVECIVLEDAIDGDIQHRMQRGAGWNKLEQCFRWRAIKKYLEESGVPDTDARTAEIRGMLSRKRLPVPDYDAAKSRVRHLGVCGL